MGYEDHDLCVKGLSVLIANLGNVEAERFVSLMNRRKHLYTEETVHSLAEKARRTGEMLRNMDKVRL